MYVIVLLTTGNVVHAHFRALPGTYPQHNPSPSSRLFAPPLAPFPSRLLDAKPGRGSELTPLSAGPIPAHPRCRRQWPGHGLARALRDDAPAR